MSTTTPYTFPLDKAELTKEKLDAFVEWYHCALGDEDKAGDPDDCYYYEGFRSSLESVLALLCDVKDLSELEPKRVQFTTQLAKEA